MKKGLKENAKDPKVLAIGALLAILGVTNADTVSNVVTNVSQSVQLPAEAKPPEIKMDGPETVNEGDPVIFSAAESYGDHFTWIVSPKQSITLVNESRSCVLPSRPGNYEITLIVGNCEGQVSESRSYTVVGVECPDIPAIPPVDPVDPVDPGLAGLAKDAYQLGLSKVIATARKDAGKIAIVYESLANDTSITSQQDFVDKTLAGLIKTLGSDTESWKPWHEAMNLALQIQITQGKLLTITQYRAAWLQIAKGLKSL